MKDCYACILYVWLVGLVALGLWVNDCSGQMGDQDAKLHELLSSPSRAIEDATSTRPEMPRICLEVGNKAVPVVSDSLSRTLPDLASNPTRENAALTEIGLGCLARIGGPDVVQLLERLYDESKNEALKHVMRAALCWAMQSTGSAEDIRFLIDSLKGPIGGLKGVAPTAAAYSLAVLRPQSARAALERRAKEFTNVRQEVKFALARINGNGWNTPQIDSASGADLLILAVFRFGIPRTDMSAFVESKAKRLWKRNADAWRFEPLDGYDPNLPEISFDLFVTKDGTRAICSVSIRCGNVCGYGYDYILNNGPDGWRVVGLFPTWIS